MNREAEIKTAEFFPAAGVSGRGSLYGLELSDDFNSCSYEAGPAPGEESTFMNTATCPDCSGGMVRQGRCQFCPECGYESCFVT